MLESLAVFERDELTPELLKEAPEPVPKAAAVAQAQSQKENSRPCELPNTYDNRKICFTSAIQQPLSAKNFR